MPNLNLNVIANYASFAYVAGISLAVMPLLHQELGSEYFGLIGIHVLLTNILGLLDLGFSTTVSRECAVHRNNPKSAGILPHIIRVTGFFFHAAAGILIFGFIALPDSITLQWLSTDQIPPESARGYLLLILLSITIRWVSGLYRGVINGFESQITTSIINALSATLRFPVAYALILQSNEPTITYFRFQILIVLIEYVLLYLISRKLTCHIHPATLDSAGFKKLFYRIISLSASISILTIVTTLYTQIDKIILAKILPLAQYGDFSLILVATTGIASLAGPISTALIPRLTNLTANRNAPQVFDEYIKSQKILLMLMLPCGMSCIFLAPRILFAWTGNVQFSTDMAAIFGVYAMGNVIWVISALPGYLKYAAGEMNFLLKYNLALLLVYAPSALLMGLKFGPIGAGVAWLVVNALALLVSHATIHRKFFSLEFRKVIIQEVSIASAVAGILIFIAYVVLPEPSSRFGAALQSLACLAVTAATIYAVLSTFGKQAAMQKNVQ
jgi:O-antigen/teichoic acid export membrane protein